MPETPLRFCRKCGTTADTEEELELFRKCSQLKYGRANFCKKCDALARKAYVKANYSEVRAQAKVHYAENREKILAKSKVYTQEHKEELAAYNKTYYRGNRERFAEKNKEYQAANRGKINTKSRENYHKNPDMRLKSRLRARLGGLLDAAGYKKSVSAVSDIGCSMEALKIWLSLSAELNYGIVDFNWEEHYDPSVYHIDHIKPLDAFDLTDPEQQLEAVHYTNLQLLTVADNLTKGNTYDVHCG